MDDSRQPLTFGLGFRPERNLVTPRAPLGTERVVHIFRSLLHNSPLLCIIHLLLHNLFQFADSDCVFGAPCLKSNPFHTLAMLA